MKRNPYSLLSAVLLAGALLAPAARAADPDTDPDRKSEQSDRVEGAKEKKFSDETCPTVSVLTDADHSTVFDGKGRDVTNIVYKATLNGPVVSCKHKGNGRLNIDVSAVIGAEAGLSAGSKDIDIPYFVAVIDPEELVVAKQQATATVRLEKGNRTGAVTVKADRIELQLAEDTIGRDLEVIVSLQLTKDELDFNRAGH